MYDVAPAAALIIAVSWAFILVAAWRHRKDRFSAANWFQEMFQD